MRQLKDAGHEEGVNLPSKMPNQWLAQIPNLTHGSIFETRSANSKSRARDCSSPQFA
ncbi:MAG: hypothetical protein VX470_00280 [Planctomycetota bacterium]|nr:hypothetical protein [Planctomycetota bacterium]